MFDPERQERTAPAFFANIEDSRIKATSVVGGGPSPRRLSRIKTGLTSFERLLGAIRYGAYTSLIVRTERLMLQCSYIIWAVCYIRYSIYWLVLPFALSGICPSKLFSGRSKLAFRLQGKQAVPHDDTQACRARYLHLRDVLKATAHFPCIPMTTSPS